MNTVTDHNFITEVLEAEQIVLVKCFAAWCKPCDALTPIIDAIAVKNPEIKIVQVDTDECLGICSEYKIRGVPTLLIFKNGQLCNRHTGMIKEESLIKLIDV